jgi:hexosaminidase
MLPYVWNSLDDYLDLGNRVANAGFPVVLCNVDNFYLDLAYTHHPDEPGHYWGGFVNTRRAFEFIPFHVFHSTITNKYRIPYGQGKSFEGFVALRPDARENIVGLQGQLWSEHIKGADLLEYAYLPKMLGLVERAWTGQPDWGSIKETGDRIEAINLAWNEFANVIGHRDLPRLDFFSGGYNYRLPPPGAVIREGILHANVDFPGLTIRYSTDGSDPTMESPVYLEALEVSGPVRLATFDTRGRKSRISVAEIK